MVRSLRKPLLGNVGVRAVKAILVGTTLCFAVAAAYMSLLIFERQESLSRVSHYDVAWSASHGVNEFIRLNQRITALAAVPTPERMVEAKLRFDILKGRLSLFQSGAFRTFVSESQERQRILDRFNEVVAQLEQMLPNAAMPGVAGKLLEIMEPLEADLVGFASDAAYFSSVKITDFEDDLRRLHRNFSITAFGFFACGLAFVALLGWNNRLLSRTHRSLETANRDLQSATTDLEHMAHHDLLTGLANRRLFRVQLERELAREDSPSGVPAVLCLDIDNFKNINDSLGHACGDALLCQVAIRVEELVGTAGLVARFGGDEFVVLLNESSQAHAASMADAMVETFAQPFHLEGHQVVVGTSIGIAVAWEPHANPDMLLRNADLALYRAKSEGKGIYRFFEPEMDAQQQRRRVIDLLLRAAEFDRDFTLLFQPLIDLQTNEVTTIEALLRWRNTRFGSVFPDEFIPIAEDNGVVVPLGAWVLRQACAVAARLADDVRVAVNVSATQFRRSDVVETVREALSQTGLNPGRLELEITESLLLDDSKEVHVALKKLRELGVRISLDDFGTGFSSLAYLNKFAVDKVKIDRSFVSGITTNDDHLSIVQAIVGLSRTLGIASVAEGVETEEQLLLIRASGCNQAQGYYFSRPVPERQIHDLLTGERSGANVA